MKLTQQMTGRFPVNVSWTDGIADSGGNARRRLRIRRVLAFAAMISAGCIADHVHAQDLPAPTVLANFSLYSTGANPMSGVIAGPDGNLYGVAYHGGPLGSSGTLFKFDRTTGMLGSPGMLSQALITLPVGPVVFDGNGNIIGAAEGDGAAAGALFQYSPAGNSITQLPANVAPEVGLTVDKSGTIYGVNTGDAPLGGGTPGIFSLSGPAHTFSTIAPLTLDELAKGYSSLVADASGNLYGTTQLGGVNAKGSIFRVDAITHQVTTVHSFGGGGEVPMTALSIDSQGNLFGATTQITGPSGTISGGTVFEWSPGTQTFSTLYTFGAASDGYVPLSPLTIDDAGDLFGTTSITANGAGHGTVFEIDGRSHALMTLAYFNGVNGDTPVGPLLLEDGMLYGTTEYGGLSNQGVLYEVAVPEPASFLMVIPFVGLLTRRRRKESAALKPPLDFRVQRLVGIAIAAAGAGSLPPPARAQTPTVLASFSYYASGTNPASGVIAGPDGNLYGVTTGGGAYEAGSLFKYDRGTGVLSSVAFQNSAQAAHNPIGPIAFDNNGNVVGLAASYGGLTGSGGVYAYQPGQNSFTVLSGASAVAGVAKDAVGNIYGIDLGQSGTSINQSGDIFQISGSMDALSLFAPMQNSDLNAKPSTLVADASGNLYGTTQLGGANGKGSIFRVDAVTRQVTTVHSFGGGGGQVPMTSLSIDSHGNLFGTTSQASDSASTGTVFEWSPATETLSTIYTFGTGNSGHLPLSLLTIDANGDLFGTTEYSGGFSDGHGTVFEIDGQSHALTTLVDFNGVDGNTPAGPLLLQNGMLYGTTEYGGVNNEGVLYEVAVPEPASLAMVIPFVGLLARRRRRDSVAS